MNVVHFGANEFEVYSMKVNQRLFLLVQVRRMVGTLVAVGRGKLSVDHVQDLLDTRDSTAYPQNMAAPPYGLFLINVEYNDSGKDSIFFLQISNLDLLQVQILSFHPLLFLYRSEAVHRGLND